MRLFPTRSQLAMRMAAQASARPIAANPTTPDDSGKSTPAFAPKSKNPATAALSQARKVDAEESIHLASAIKKTYPKISVHPTVPKNDDDGICVLVEDGSEGKKASGGTGWLVCCLETVGEKDMIVCYAAKIKAPDDPNEPGDVSHYAVLGGKVYGVSRGRRLAENPQQNPFWWGGSPYYGYPTYPYYTFAYPYYAWGGYPYYYPWYGYGYPWWGVWYGGGFRRHRGRPMGGMGPGGGMGGGGFSPMGPGGGFSPMGAGGGGGGMGKNPFMPWNINYQGYPTV